MPSPSRPDDRNYKRSWKNLLINKRYQLRFTLFMVGLSTVLMVGLGAWVMKVANETTAVAQASVRGTACPPVPPIAASGDGTAAGGRVDGAVRVDPPGRTTAPAAGGERETRGAANRPRGNVQLDQSSITMLAPAPTQVPADFGARVVAHWTCELRLAGNLQQLERGRQRILWVLIATGLLLVLGLAAYGIKMTHKVAGPLFKVGLYLGKMREGRFDKVHNLRKGDQLVDFYEHFRQGHAGVVQLQQADIDRLAAVIAAADAAGAGGDAAIAELRAMLARKEQSVE